MKIAVISFTRTGRRLARRVAHILRKEGHAVHTAVKGAEFSDSVRCSLSEWTKAHFRQQDALVFVGAAGIAVRAVAPYIRSKTKDAAVLVLDEKGNYCIPVLSGHIGGGNELALMIGKRLPAVPVITTATDIQGKWAADVFAVKNNLAIKNMEKAKQISAGLLSGKNVFLSIGTDGIVESGAYPDLLKIGYAEEEENPVRPPDIYVGYDRKDLSEKSLCLIPRAVTAGIGCKKGTDEKAIRSAVENTLKKAGIFKESLEKAASIDLKADEKGLADYCKNSGIPFVTYPAEELLKAEGEFSGSEFVKQVTGVDNVCERSALLASGGRLAVKKQVYDGITVALAVRKWRVRFE